MNEKVKISIKTITAVAAFSALAFITTLVCKLIPTISGFLTLDAKDAVIAIASFIYGPIVAPLISLIVAIIEAIYISETQFWGFVMNFTSSAVFSLTASLIYKYKKSFNGAIIGFSAAVVVTTAVMMLLNPLIIPLFTPAVTREIVIVMIPTLLLPFNFAKTLINSALAMLLYKPIVNAMRTAGFVKKAEHKTEFNKLSVLTLVCSGIAMAISVVILIIIW